MRKIVPKLLVISSQILIGALFLIFTINTKSEIKLRFASKEIEKLSQFVYDEETYKSSDVYEEEDLVFSDDEQEEKEIFEESEVKKEVISEEVKEEKKEFIDSDSILKDKFFMDKEIINSYTGILTGYGPDCVGCGNYKTNKVSTSSGYHIADIVDGVIQPAFTTTYMDDDYGEVRIVAGDSTLPYYSIVRISIPEQDPIMAIVLDRGSTVGFENCRSDKGCLTNFDLLFATESEAIGKTYNVTFDILRMGA